MPRTQLRLWPVEVPEGTPSLFLGSIVQIDAVTLRLSGRVPTLAYDLWPATDAACDAEATVVAAAVPSAQVALIGPDLPVPAPPAPGEAPAEDPFETYPVAVANEFFSDGQAAEVWVADSPRFEALCGARTNG